MTNRLTSPRSSMPHISSLLRTDSQLQCDNDGTKQKSGLQRSRVNITEIHSSASSTPQKRGGNDQMVLITPQSLGPIRTKRQDSFELYSASSKGGSVFDSPRSTFESPDSTTSNPFVAELEDTSQKGFVPNGSVPLIRAPSISDALMLLKCKKTSSLAIIKVIDENIAALEADNRALTSRAQGAEAKVRRLREANAQLRRLLEEHKGSCTLSTSIMKKDAAIQTNQSQESAILICEGATVPSSIGESASSAPLSTSGRVVPAQHHIEAKSKKSIRDSKILYRTQSEAPPQLPPKIMTGSHVHLRKVQADNQPSQSERYEKESSLRNFQVTPPLLNDTQHRLQQLSRAQIVKQHPLSAHPPSGLHLRVYTDTDTHQRPTQNTRSKASSNRPHTSEGTMSKSSALLSNSPPLPPLPHNFDLPPKLPLRGPHKRLHTRSLSFENKQQLRQLRPQSQNCPPTLARLCTKPLPPLGPMSPSVIQGVVEIGLSVKDDGFEGSKDYDLLKDKKVRSWGKKTGAKILKWGKKEAGLT